MKRSIPVWMQKRLSDDHAAIIDIPPGRRLCFMRRMDTVSVDSYISVWDGNVWKKPFKAGDLGDTGKVCLGKRAYKVVEDYQLVVMYNPFEMILPPAPPKPSAYAINLPGVQGFWTPLASVSMVAPGDILVHPDDHGRVDFYALLEATLTRAEAGCHPSKGVPVRCSGMPGGFGDGTWNVGEIIPQYATEGATMWRKVCTDTPVMNSKGPTPSIRRQLVSVQPLPLPWNKGAYRWDWQLSTDQWTGCPDNPQVKIIRLAAEPLPLP